MSIKHKVTLLKEGFRTVSWPWQNHQQLTYTFLADKVEWLTPQSIKVTYGQASWPIHNVEALDCLLSKSWFPVMPPQGLEEKNKIKALEKVVRQLEYDKACLSDRARLLEDALSSIKKLVKRP